MIIRKKCKCLQNTATSPFQSNWDVEDALQELDSALNPVRIKWK